MSDKETQKAKVLRLLRQRPQKTMDLVLAYVMAPAKCIQYLREDGYNILTLPIEGKKEKLYKLIEEPKQVKLF